MPSSLGAGETVVPNRQLQLWQMDFLIFLMHTEKTEKTLTPTAFIET